MGKKEHAGQKGQNPNDQKENGGAAVEFLSALQSGPEHEGHHDGGWNGEAKMDFQAAIEVCVGLYVIVNLGLDQADHHLKHNQCCDGEGKKGHVDPAMEAVFFAPCGPYGTGQQNRDQGNRRLKRQNNVGSCQYFHNMSLHGQTFQQRTSQKLNISSWHG